MGYRILMVAVVIIISTLLFYKASGNLSLTKLNMISVIYYFMLGYNLIGGSLIYIGVREHYLVQKVKYEETFINAYYALAYCAIMLPITLILVRKACNRLLPRHRNMDVFIETPLRYNRNMLQVQEIALVLMFITTLATIYVFRNLGYVPILSMFDGSNINMLRQAGSRYFQGNQYVKNLLMTALTPYVSYYIYVYFRRTKARSWMIMFVYQALLSIIVLTYDFSKSPIITYLVGLYLVEVNLGTIKDGRKICKIAVVVVLIIFFFYVVMLGASRDIMSIYTGPIGRVLFTQIATLFLHFDAFPAKHAFLHGASFNSWMSFIFPTAEGLRSGRLVMTIYNASAVEAGTAGVMNTLFIGEAYANLGVVGVIIAPIIFGIVIGLFAYVLPSLKKRPTSILLYVQITLQLVMMVEGGFVDIFYSASVIFYILTSLLIHLFTEYVPHTVQAH